MEKRKNNKKLFAIIAGSALAFVLTIALSVSITLAYFGETKEVTRTATLGAKVEVGATSTTNELGIEVLPTQLLEINAAATCPESTTDSVLWAIVWVDGTSSQLMGQTEQIVGDWVEYGTTTKTVGEDDDTHTVNGTVYYYSTATNPTKLGKTTVADKSLTYKFIVPAILDSSKTNDNHLAKQTLVISVQFVRVQEVYLANGTDLAEEAKDFETAVETVGSITITPKTA